MASTETGNTFAIQRGGLVGPRILTPRSECSGNTPCGVLQASK
jgi:hypothetical protein